MKISYVSDLHLEFGYQELPGGEVLILAGDICEARSLEKCFHQTKLVDRTPGSHRYSDFFQFECAKYEKVFMVMGNHEHYHGRFDKTYTQFKSILPDNVTLLENEVVEYNGVMFMGATLWTDCNNADQLTMYHLKAMMNDYKVVTNHYKEKGIYHKLIPEVTFRKHVLSKQYFQSVLSSMRDKPFVVITHHGPSHLSVHPNYKDDQIMNGGYVSNLGEFILDNENIKLWFHGHVHDPVDYMIGETRVLCNPGGYPSERTGNGFDPAKFIEL